MNPTAKSKRMPIEDFEAFVSRTRMGESARDMARMVLVDGVAQAEVAARYSVTPQRVNQAVSALRKMRDSLPSTQGWGSVADVDMPPEMRGALFAFLAEAKLCEDDEERRRAVDHAVRALELARKMLREDGKIG